ncbi:MAG: GIY-YIG nuclease family protein [Bacteroidia bacterium]|nr:GIY-YIG nuclease family protein [Bacteroidia bacterium]NNM22834.1 GIY-YIG nuclease family protein [Flavobacteriaceae bacterium]
MYFVYVLFSEDFGRSYIGISANVKNRLRAHNSGKVKSTKAFVPWLVKHHEKFDSRKQARQREKYLKSAAGRRWRKNNLGM